jgi:hypothetical protein
MPCLMPVRPKYGTLAYAVNTGSFAPVASPTIISSDMVIFNTLDWRLLRPSMGDGRKHLFAGVICPHNGRFLKGVKPLLFWG